MRVGCVLVLTFEVEDQILRREKVGELSTDGVYRVVGEPAGWDSQIG